MATQVIDRAATTTAAPDVVSTLLADGSTWPEWSPIGSFELLDAGEGVAGGRRGGPALHHRSHQEQGAGGGEPSR